MVSSTTLRPESRRIPRIFFLLIARFMHLQAHHLIGSLRANLHSTTHSLFDIHRYYYRHLLGSFDILFLVFCNTEAVGTPRITGLDVDSVSRRRHLNTDTVEDEPTARDNIGRKLTALPEVRRTISPLLRHLHDFILLATTTTTFATS